MEGKIAAKLTQNFTLNRRKMLFSAGLAFFLFSVSFALGATAQAASLYFSPSAGSYQVGKTFSVSVYVESPGQAMNAASGVISFPQDKLEITSLAKTGSIISLWVQEPSFSNSVGTINFEGIVLNPGFSGSNGKIITLNFKAKSAGNALLRFASGSVLANDGQGTNILSSLGSASFSLEVPVTGPAAPQATTPSETAGAPPSLQIYSSTHPDPNNWYAASTAKFNWDLPPGTTAVRLLVDDIPQAIPTVNYVPPISSKEIADLADGIWYLHIRLKNAQGWGAVSHFRFQIDTEPPEPFLIKFVDGNETDNPRPTVVFETTDSLSGIEYYKVKIGEGDFFPISTETVKHNPYTLPPQAPGKHTIIVQAFDWAGNYITGIDEFIIKSIDAPTFTDYPSQLRSGEVLTIKGTTYPNSWVVVWLQREKDEPKSQTVKSDENGNFTFIAQEKLKDGIYKIWAEVINQQNAKSIASQIITVLVKQSTLLKIGSLAITYLTIIISLIALAVLLAFLIWYSWHRFSKLRKKLRKEVFEAQEASKNAFSLLKRDVAQQIKLLEKTKNKRPLTSEEEKVTKELKKDLEEAEEYVKKEIKDIEKGLK